MKLCVQDRAALDGRLAPWLYTVCRNRALDVRKKDGRMNTMEPAVVDGRPGNMPAPNVIAMRNENHTALLAAVDRLPEHQQEAFRLKFEHGLTYRQIAQVLGKPLSTVSYTLTGALKTLRTEMKDHLKEIYTYRRTINRLGTGRTGCRRSEAGCRSRECQCRTTRRHR